MTTASLVSNKKNNIDLVLTPNKSSAPISELDIYDLVESSEYGVLQLVKNNVKNAIAELNDVLKSLQENQTGREIRYEILVRIDATIQIKIDSDDMQASAEITAAQGGAHLSAKGILNAAKEQGVIKGFIKEQLIALAQAGARAKPSTQVTKIIAKGKPAIKGKDTKIKMLVESAQSRVLRPQAREDGTVDMRNLGDIICVKVGDPLAQRIPFTLGIKGYTVKGKDLEPLPGEDCQIEIGEGTVLSPKNNNVLISTLVGLPKVIDNGMSVEKVYKVNNVDVGSGHIKFEGNVIIEGDVKESMKVIASGDITVGGFVESATLEAGGDVIIQKGIIGRKQEVETNNVDDIKMSAFISAKGNIHATYSQYTELVAGKDITIENQLMHSIITLDGKLWVGQEDKLNGKLIAGHISAGTSVHAGSIGASAGSNTYITFDKQVKKYKQRIEAIDEKINDEIEKTQELRGAAERLRQLPQERADKDMLAKVVKTYQHHASTLGDLHNDKEREEQALQFFMESVYVEGREHIYHGVEVRVGDFVERSRREYGPSKIFYSERKVIIDPIVNN
ncbi:FapA family protein [Thalassotalea eurytherma]|uniref:Flagellar Assembly Protein A N-terminal region domain-containing protein n=1 Tax=Thalassotalea eurytherma TaxID=1144278 RepID=A0ABQ6H473_9GAMM|nr:FapA family protein [Thalassotalea eurytherma]GLX81535.1 hypothetical protein theurythT_09870 [Thalassotalea eurytherma]